MFQKRLKNFLIVLLVVTVALMLRALQLQVFGREQWTEQAARVFAPPVELIETVRGRILDVKGRELAVDSPCIDLCVDYRAITAADQTPEEQLKDKWLRALAASRLRDRLGDAYNNEKVGTRKRMVDDEIPHVLADIDHMWSTIARATGKTREEIEDTRRSVVQRVEMRRRYVWVNRWRDAVAGQKALPQAPWYQRWLLGEADDELSVDSFDLSVGEQTAAHVIVPDVPEEVRNFFSRNPQDYPGLTLKPGIKRVYPYNEAACHLIGRLSKVTREDLLADDETDELRKYWKNDLIGRTGVEALAERALRGSRGKSVRRGGKEDTVEPRRGADVFMTIDIDLQRQLQQLFKHVPLKEGDNDVSYHEMHGAAVVIDVESGEVRAMASYPDFDLNRYDEDYNKLAADALNAPLLNRATQVAREPGSTAKPMIGLGALTQGLFTPDSRIECTGYLVLGNHRYSVGRCWVASKFGHITGFNVAHHQTPWSAPHPTGFLNFADALERSCNVYFETVGDKLGIDGESHWFREFGLGRPTGIGIAETPGYVPADVHLARNEVRSATWMSAIGQVGVAATPLQMANVAATIARDGVWKRPRLVLEGTPTAKPKPSSQPADKQAREEDMVDLHLSPAAVRAAKLGMYNVVNGPAGTGKAIVLLEGSETRTDPALAHLRIAGKTGTAQASPVRVPVTDADGDVVKDERGKPVTRLLKPGIHGAGPGEADWYHAIDEEGKHFNHAWFMGFAPAERPRIAFAVMVEYGESGGATAGRVAKHVVEACVQHGYLPPSDR